MAGEFNDKLKGTEGLDQDKDIVEDLTTAGLEDMLVHFFAPMTMELIREEVKYGPAGDRDAVLGGIYNGYGPPSFQECVCQGT